MSSQPEGKRLLVLYLRGYRNLYINWALATAFVLVFSIVILFRFLGGKWRTMRVIEEEVPPPHLGPHPTVPPTETE